MKYFQRYPRYDGSLAGNDPLSGVAHLFDLGLAFIVGLLLAPFGDCLPA